jgi:hypothetical protein
VSARGTALFACGRTDGSGRTPTVLPDVVPLGTRFALRTANVPPFHTFGTLDKWWEAPMRQHVAVALLVVLLGVADLALGQQPPATSPPPGQSGSESPVKLYLDCRSTWCDSEYIRTEITFVDHVRDRNLADVHVLVTTERTSNGTQYTLNFIGRQRFEAITQTLRYVSQDTDTEDDTRKGLVRTLKLGLVQYVAQTPQGGLMEVSYRAPKQSQAGQTTKDPWHFWVFRGSLSSYSNGEKYTSWGYTYGSFSANRTTAASKTSLSISGEYDQSDYTFEDGSTFRAITRDYAANALLIRTLGARWGGGVRMGVSSSTYYNQARVIKWMPAIEYNIYPYSESTRRQLTFRYAAGIQGFRYQEETIFDKTAETMVSHSMVAELNFRQPWGTVSTSAELSQYIPQFNKNRARIGASVDLRLFKGLSLSLGGRASFVRDQIYLAKGGASDEEVLVRQRQLATSYQYYYSIGFSYTFGSAFNNVVNSRLADF